MTGVINMDTRYSRVLTDLVQVGGGLIGGYKTPTHHGLLTDWAGLGGPATFGNTHTRVAETLGMETNYVSAQTASTGSFTPSVGVELTGGKTALWQLDVNWTG